MQFSRKNNLLTVSQFVKAKGGMFITAINSKRVKVTLRLGTSEFIHTTDLGLEGIRTIENIFHDVSGIKPARISPAAAGVDRSYICREYEGDDFETCFENFASAVQDEQSLLCESGFYHVERAATVGTPMDFEEGKVDIACCKTPAQKRYLTAYLESEQIEGTWDGDKFIRADSGGGGCNCAEEIRETLLQWLKVDYAKPRQAVIKAGTSEVKNFDSLGEKFLYYHKLAVNAWAKADQERLYYANGKVLSKNSGVASKLFVRSEEMIDLDQFIDDAIERCAGVFRFGDKNLGCSSIGDFVVGQMLRSQAQMIVDTAARTIRYEPTPEPYKQKMQGTGEI